MKTAWLAALWLVTGMAFAQPACKPGDAPCDAMRRMDNHPVKRLDYWAEALRRPFRDRVGIANAELMEYLELDAIKIGIPERPRRARPDAAFWRDLRAALAELPPQLGIATTSRFAGVYLVENLGSSGFTDVIRDRDGREEAAFVVLDSGVLAARTANEWATWKENTPFTPAGGATLTAVIERAEGDNRKNAIQYILLHELGHVMSVGSDIHPPWDSLPREMPRGKYPYFDLSWSVERGKYVTRFDASFPARNDIVYYFGPKLASVNAAAVYGQLEQTNFATLYAATHPGDDFAEAFASYVHTQLMGRPFEITFMRDGTVVKTYRDCWSEPRCAEKRRWFEAFFAKYRPAASGAGRP